MSRPLTTTELKRLHRLWRQRRDREVSLALVSLSNPFNVGSIFRSAAAFGADTVHLVGATPGPQEAKVKKTALGTDSDVRTETVATLADLRQQLAGTGTRLVAVELTAEAHPIHEYAFPARTCLVLGAEAHGLPPAALAACDDVVFIAQAGKVASLNVAVAASIALHEVRRRDWDGPSLPELDTRAD